MKRHSSDLMSRRNALWTISAGFGAALVGCWRTPATNNSPPKTSPSTHPVKIGFLTALTGLETILGETQLNCFKLAIEEINAAGGLNGRDVSYLVEDDQTSARGCVEKARKLIFEDKVDVIIGLIASLEHVATREVTGPAKKPLIYTTYYEGGVSEKYFVATGQVPNQQIAPTTKWLVENIGKTVYVLGSDFVWPRKSFDAIKAEFESLGGKVHGSEFFPFGTQDFGPTFKRIQDAKPDMVWTMFAGADAVTGLKQYRSFGLKPTLVSNGLDEIFSFAHPDLTEGVISNQSYFMTIDSEANRRFVSAYGNRFGKDKPINSIGESTYAATHLYALAVKKAGSANPDDVLVALPSVKFVAPQGEVQIDANNQHMISHSRLAKANKKGHWDIITDFGPIAPRF